MGPMPWHGYWCRYNSFISPRVLHRASPCMGALSVADQPDGRRCVGGWLFDNRSTSSLRSLWSKKFDNFAENSHQCIQWHWPPGPDDRTKDCWKLSKTLIIAKSHTYRKKSHVVAKSDTPSQKVTRRRKGGVAVLLIYDDDDDESCRTSHKTIVFHPLQLQLWTNGTLEEHLPATTFGAPASSTAGHVGWREVARNRGILHSHGGA